MNQLHTLTFCIPLLLNYIFFFPKYTLYFLQWGFVNSKDSLTLSEIFLNFAITLCSEYREALPRSLFRNEGLIPWAAGSSASRQISALIALHQQFSPRLNPLPLSAYIPWLMSQVYEGWAHLPQLLSSQIQNEGLHWDQTAGQLFPLFNLATSLPQMVPDIFLNKLSIFVSDSVYASREVNLGKLMSGISWESWS